MCSLNCPACGEDVQTDNSNQKCCNNFDCDNYGHTYLHHEWVEIKEKYKTLTVDNEVNKLMEYLLN